MLSGSELLTLLFKNAWIYALLIQQQLAHALTNMLTGPDHTEWMPSATFGFLYTKLKTSATIMGRLSIDANNFCVSKVWHYTANRHPPHQTRGKITSVYCQLLKQDVIAITLIQTTPAKLVQSQKTKLRSAKIGTLQPTGTSIPQTNDFSKLNTLRY